MHDSNDESYYFLWLTNTITINNKHYLGASPVFKKKDLYLSRTALKWFWFEAQRQIFFGEGGGGGYNLNLKSWGNELLKQKFT